MTSAATVAGAGNNERSEMFMWESNSHLTLHRMRDFVMQTMTQPKMQVLIPKRAVTVPHTRSKRIQQLQARPRDPNASPFLLMIAPPSDCRYRLMNRSESSRSQQNGYKEASNGERHRASVNQLSRRQQTPQSVGPMTNAWQESLNCVPGPEYLHQISTIAAMAWSDCSQATEKLRRIYEQTALLSQNPISVMNSCGQTPMTPSAVVHDFAGKLNGGFPHLQQQELLKYDASTMKPFYDDRPWEMPAVYCACAVCQMTKRAKSSMSSQRTKGGDVGKATQQTQHHIKQQHLVDQQAIAAGLAGQNVRRHKRSLSPDMASYQQQQPPRKSAKHDLQAVAKQRGQPPTGQTFLNHNAKTVNGALLPYMNTGQPPTFPDEATYLAQNLFMSGLQNPGASSYLTSSGDMVTPRELMVTPSFESQFFTAPQNGGGASLGGGILNGFSSFLPPRILNALE